MPRKTNLAVKEEICPKNQVSPYYKTTNWTNVWLTYLKGSNQHSAKTGQTQSVLLFPTLY